MLNLEVQRGLLEELDVRAKSEQLESHRQRALAVGKGVPCSRKVLHEITEVSTAWF